MRAPALAYLYLQALTGLDRGASVYLKTALPTLCMAAVHATRRPLL